MNTKANQRLLGGILIILGLYMLIGKSDAFSLGSLSSLAAGCALLLLYYTKRKTWALVIGTIILTSALSGIIKPIPYLGHYLGGAITFIIPGLMFLTLFFRSGTTAYLLPGNLLCFMGVSSFLNNFAIIHRFGNVLFICIGLAFLTTYFIAQGRIGKWTLYLGAIILICSIGMFTGRVSAKVFNFIPGLSWILLIVLGIYMIVKSIHNTHKDKEQ